VVWRSFGIKDEEFDILSQCWIPKPHQWPYKQCYIAASVRCSTKPDFKLLTYILSVVKTSIHSYWISNSSSLIPNERQTTCSCFTIIHPSNIILALIIQNAEIVNKLTTTETKQTIWQNTTEDGRNLILKNIMTIVLTDDWHRIIRSLLIRFSNYHCYHLHVLYYFIPDKTMAIYQCQWINITLCTQTSSVFYRKYPL
jgi:hypothetical protein